MSDAPPLDPPPRMRRRLMATLRSHRGLVEGEVWWMNRTKLVLLSPEQFPEGQRLEARIDLGGTRGQVDLRITIEAQSRNRIRRAYVHGGRWSVADRQVQAHVYEVLQTLNPDEDWGDQPTAQPPPPPKPAPPTPRPKPKPKPKPKPPAVSTADSSDPQVQLSPGPPASLFAAFQTPGALGRCVALLPDRVRLTLPRVDGLHPDQSVLVALRTPRGMFLELACRVASTRRVDVVLETTKVEPATQAVLQGILGRS